MEASKPKQALDNAGALALLRLAAISQAQPSTKVETNQIPEEKAGQKKNKRVRKRKPCKHEHCEKRDAGGGFCKKHGGGSRCKVTACSKSNAGGGKCVKHGGGNKCKEDKCEKAAATAGGKRLCVAHGGGNRCDIDSCNNLVQRKKQKCISHGGEKRNRDLDKTEIYNPLAAERKVPQNLGNKEARPCLKKECDSPSIVRGFCKSHSMLTASGQRYCRHQLCLKRDVGGGFCTSHGGGRRCKVEKCETKSAGSKGLCTSHGGGRRCRKEGCDKLDCGGGFCVRHGGGRRCKVSDCDKGARGSSGLCISHHGGKKCKIAECKTAARGSKGLCISHGGGYKSEILARMKRAGMRTVV